MWEHFWTKCGSVLPCKMPSVIALLFAEMELFGLPVRLLHFIDGLYNEDLCRLLLYFWNYWLNYSIRVFAFIFTLIRAATVVIRIAAIRQFYHEINLLFDTQGIFWSIFCKHNVFDNLRRLVYDLTFVLVKLLASKIAHQLLSLACSLYLFSVGNENCCILVLLRLSHYFLFQFINDTWTEINEWILVFAKAVLSCLSLCGCRLITYHKAW